MTVIHFGPGALGLGFVGELFQKKKYNIFFCSSRISEKTKILSNKCQYFHINTNTEEEKIIPFADHITYIMDDEKDKLNDLFVSSDTKFITTAVKMNNFSDCAIPISEGIAKRLEAAFTSPLFILPFENVPSNGSTLEDCVLSHLSRENNHYTKKNLVDSNIFFCNTIVDRICEIKEPPVNQNEITVHAENYSNLIIDTNHIPMGLTKQLTDNLLSDLGIKFESNPLRFKAFEDRKSWLINGVHLALAAVAYEQKILYLSRALDSRKIFRFIKEVQSALTSAFLIKYCDEENNPPFDKISLMAFNNRFMTRIIQNKHDTIERILEDLYSFDRIGELDILEFYDLINQKGTYSELTQSQVISLITTEITSKISSESAFFKKLNNRISNPAKYLEPSQAEQLNLVIVTVLQDLENISDSMKKKINDKITSKSYKFNDTTFTKASTRTS